MLSQGRGHLFLRLERSSAATIIAAATTAATETSVSSNSAISTTAHTPPASAAHGAEAIAADIDSALDVAFGRIKVVEIASVDL